METPKRERNKFICRGLKVNCPVDLMPEGKYPILKNVRAYLDGVIQTRPGLLQLGTTATATSAVHSLTSLNTASSNIYLAGVGTKLEYGTTNTSLVPNSPTGFSGNPLRFIAAKPVRSLDPWMYVADANKMRKVSVAGVDYQWGINPPNTPPSAALAGPLTKDVDNFDATTGWAGTGTGAITAPTRLAATAISQILYDTGSTGWACVQPAAFSVDIQPGMLFTTAVTTAETALIQEVHNSTTSTTIDSISYDSGTTGLCTIQMVIPSPDIEVNSMVRIAAAENVRVVSVTPGPNGVTSFRCSTASNRVAGNAIVGLRSFRAYFVNTHNTTTTISATMLQFALSGSGISYVTKTAALDLSTTSSRPIDKDDEMHISIKISNVDLLTEIRVELDVDSATNDFTRNYYYYAIRPSDLTASITGSITDLTAAQRIVNRHLIEQSRRKLSLEDGGNFDGLDPLADFDPNPDLGDSNQTTPGDLQWSEIRFKLKDLTRVGADDSRSLKDVAAIRVQFDSTAAITTVNLDSWWVGGTYGPDAPDDLDPYIYCYTARAKATGVTSNPSPPMRSGIRPHKQRVTLTGTQHTDGQVDVLDWYRYGGSLLEWHYVGTSTNSSTPTFTDDLPDDDIAVSPRLEFDNFVPFPLPDSPRTGTCSVIGTTVLRTTGDTFNTSWARGTIIVIDGVATTLYASPTSTTRLEIDDSLGTRTGVTFELPSPTLMAQPRPLVWGPYGDGQGGSFIFSCYRGYLLWTKGNNPDSAPATNYIEVCSGSETLLNGCIYDGRPYVFSDQKMYGISPTDDGQGGITFIAQEVANSKGLGCTYGLTTGNNIYFIGKDGIYMSEGGQPVSLTNEDLYTLFPHDGVAGQVSNGINPPDFTVPNKLRLNFYDGKLYCDFQDTSGSLRTLIYDGAIGGWFYDLYTPTVVCHYGVERADTHLLLMGSSSSSILYASATTTDDIATSIALQVRTPSRDQGETRAQKQYWEVMLDTSAVATIPPLSVTIGFDNHSQTIPSSLIAVSARTQSLIDLSSGLGRFARNISLDIQSTGAAGVQLYEWQPSFIVHPEDTQAQATDWDDLGTPGAKFIQGIELEADTAGVAKTVQMQYDGGTVGATLTVNHATRRIVAYPNAGSPTWTPFIAHQIRLVPTSSISWKRYGYRVIYEPEPDLATWWQTQGLTHGLVGFQHLRDCFIALRSTATVTMVINIDGIDYSYTLASTAGNYRKVYVPFRAIKGKVFGYKFTSAAGFRLYLKDCEIAVKAWGTTEAYQIIRPFGAEHNRLGATI